MSKAMKGIGVIQKLNKTLPCHSLITIYKSFMRPHLDYGDIIYDQPNNKSFAQKIERTQYKAALAITGAIKGTSQSKLYRELFYSFYCLLITLHFEIAQGSVVVLFSFIYISCFMLHFC